MRKQDKPVETPAATSTQAKYAPNQEIAAAAALGAEVLAVKQMMPEGKFLTAEQLRLTEAEYEGLMRALYMFENGKIGQDEFRMQNWYTWVSKKKFSDVGEDNVHGCGTTACLAGWANFLTDGKAFSNILNDRFAKRWGAQPDTDRRNKAESIPNAASEMFRGVWGDLGGNDTRRAAIALRTYLETGAHGWKKALKAEFK